MLVFSKNVDFITLAYFLFLFDFLEDLLVVFRCRCNWKNRLLGGLVEMHVFSVF